MTIFMKKIGGLILFLGLTAGCADAQKGVLDSTAVLNWPVIRGEEISADGKFVLYLVWAYSHQEAGLGQELIVKATGSVDSIRYGGIAEAHFSMNGRYIAIRTTSDSLIIMNLGTRQETRFAGVTNYKWAGRLDRDVIAWKSDSGDLRIRDVGGHLECSIKRVKTFGYGVKGRALFAVQEPDSTTGGHKQMHLVDLDDGKDTVVWTGRDVGKVLCNEDNRELVFFGEKATGPEYSIWRYTFGEGEAKPWIRNSRDQNGDSVVLQRYDWGLLPGTGGIYFYVKMASQPGTEAKAPGTNVHIWRYDDEFEGSDELPTPPPKPKEYFLAVAYPESSKVLTVNYKKTDAFGPMTVDQNADYPFALVKNRVNRNEEYRLPAERPDIYLVNLRDGSRRCVARRIRNASPNFSRKGQYVYWFNAQDVNYYTYNLKTGKTVNVSAAVKFPLYNDYYDEPKNFYPYGAVDWQEDDGRMLVYDKYDIWALDPDGVRPPVNLTGGYGRAKKIQLRFAYLSENNINNINIRIPVICGKDTVLLCGFDERTMGNGFFKLNLKGTGSPQRLAMGNAVYYHSEDIGGSYFPKELKKAAGTDTYLLKEMRPGLYPNLRVTLDFRSFTPVSALEPQRNYNWLTDTLVHWKTFAGKEGQGILYRPKDFDPGKRYPVIFYFYDRLSTQLNFYLEPDFSQGAINIPWFVSRGYLVFCPDIRYHEGNPGAGVFDYVVSAAEYLAKKTWVDSTRMGINGHSWGGFEVNYLVTRTKLFAAAVSGSGLANMTSEYGLEGFPGGPANCEIYQNRMGIDLCAGWKNYVDNSPVFRADKVVTPLLMMANPKDASVPWEQGVEFFTGLRRLGKKVWMLEYPDAFHGVTGANARDFTTRLTDFFDYYLKGAAQPDWMMGRRGKSDF